MSRKEQNDSDQSDCTVHSHPVPPAELHRYAADSDFHSERDIVEYVESQAGGERVLHIEKIKTELVFHDVYDIWDVSTDKDRFWVISNLTNLYSQKHFPSMDYTLSFHIGLMMRLRDREARANADSPSPFLDVIRRIDQTSELNDRAVEPEDFQAVGMQLREALIALIECSEGQVSFPEGTELPQKGNFLSWSELLADNLCPGSSNKEIRRHLKHTAKSTWQLVGWLTHHRNAKRPNSSIALHACETVVGNFITVLKQSAVDGIEKCPACGSRQIRTHFDITISTDGAYYASCAVCEWSDHPEDV